MTPEDVETFERCIAVGGVALFPADTVYGLATEPDSREGVERLYRLKGRAPDKPAAVMFFQLELALAALPELGERTRAALERLLPGALTLLLPEPGAPLPARLRPRAGAARPARAARSRASSRRWRRSRWPVLQSSANRVRRAGRAPASRTWTPASARAWTSCSTAASCPARPRRWST